tara:strand:- start:78 stop:437 length:360 start_codon:yes stop_codon:yes gene_type:complete
MKNEYIDRLQQDDALLSSSIKDMLVPSSTDKEVPLEMAVIETDKQKIELYPQSFLLNNSECEITCEVGVNTFKNVQGIFGRPCVVSFHEFQQVLRLGEYQVDKASSSHMLVRLKFFMLG